MGQWRASAGPVVVGTLERRHFLAGKPSDLCPDRAGVELCPMALASRNHATGSRPYSFAQETDHSMWLAHAVCYAPRLVAFRTSRDQQPFCSHIEGSESTTSGAIRGIRSQSVSETPAAGHPSHLCRRRHSCRQHNLGSFGYHLGTSTLCGS